VGTITNIGDNELTTDQEIMNSDAAVSEKAKKNQKERREKEEDVDYLGQYRYAHFICHPRCGFVCDRRDEGKIINHKSVCGWAIEAREARERA
jgi:hypothetical protein